MHRRPHPRLALKLSPSQSTRNRQWLLRKRRPPVLTRRHRRQPPQLSLSTNRHQNRMRCQIAAAKMPAAKQTLSRHPPPPHNVLRRTHRCRSTDQRPQRMDRSSSTVIRRRTMVRIVVRRNRSGCRWRSICRRHERPNRHVNATIM